MSHPNHLDQYDAEVLRQILRQDFPTELTHTTVCDALIRVIPGLDQMDGNFIQETVEEAFYLLKREGFDPTKRL